MADHLSTPGTSLTELGPVLGELVHDLANELQILHGWALLARGEAAAGRVAQGELERVTELSSGLGRMLRDVLETVAGQGLSPEVVFDPLERTEAVLSDRLRELSAVKLRLVSRLPDGTRVRGRSSFWTRALSNLVGNAARYARHSVRVELSLDVSEGRPWVVLRVEDDGPGVSAAERGRMFQPLWRGAEGHTGLGLSASVWLAGQLGGSVAYDERSSLGGAAFALRVPVAPARIAPADGWAHQSGVSSHALAGLRLLVVDDDAGIRTAVGRLLRRVGAEVRELDPCGEPTERLLDRVLSAHPDVLILDLYLGEVGGVALWRQMREVLPQFARRVAFVSGAVPGDPVWGEAVATGQPVVSKPFDLAHLVAVVEELRAGP